MFTDYHSHNNRRFRWNTAAAAGRRDGHTNLSLLDHAGLESRCHPRNRAMLLAVHMDRTGHIWQQ